MKVAGKAMTLLGAKLAPGEVITTWDQLNRRQRETLVSGRFVLDQSDWERSHPTVAPTPKPRKRRTRSKQ